MDPRLLRKIESLFAPQARAEAERLLREECAALVHVPGPRDELRVHAALLKMSDGDLEKLRKGIAIRDYRDILVWSGFGAGDLWERWLEDS